MLHESISLCDNTHLTRVGTAYKKAEEILLGTFENDTSAVIIFAVVDVV
jgi:hypothetical protein